MRHRATIGLATSVALCCVCTILGAVVEAAGWLTLLAIAPPLAWALSPAHTPVRAPRVAELPAAPAATAIASEIPSVVAVAMAQARAIEQRWGKVSA